MLRNERGTTLLEIMIAMVIFASGVVVAMRSLPLSTSKTTRSRNNTVAVNLAQEKLEELMSLPFNDPDLAAGAHDDPDNPLNRHLNRTWTVVNSSPIDGVKHISVSVVYPTASTDSVKTLQTFKSLRQ